MKRRDLNLTNYNISKYRYRELYYFCLQYEERQKRIAELEHPSVVSKIDDMPHSHSNASAVEEAAISIAELRSANEDIDSSAREADIRLHPYILLSVKKGLSYTNLQTMHDIPCSRNKFDKVRHKFFFILDKKREKK